MIRRSSAPHKLRCGVLISSDRDRDRVVERELIQCCHCQFTKVFELGDEKQWGVCWRCNDWHCNKPSCVKKCVPVRQWLQNMHLGRAEDYTPVQIYVGSEVPKE